MQTDFHKRGSFIVAACIALFTLGGGPNRFSLDLQLVDDDVIWNWSSVYTGAYLYMGAHF
jgi:hypothetical protein